MRTASSAAPPPGPARERIALCGEADADRVLTVRFDVFVEGLLAAPDPCEEDLARLRPGADLLTGLMTGGEEFAGATRAPCGSGFAAQVLELTDEAFQQARRILDEGDPYYGQFGAEDPDDSIRPLLQLLDHLSGDEAFEEVCKTLLGAEGAEDPAAGAVAGAAP